MGGQLVVNLHQMATDLMRHFVVWVTKALNLSEMRKLKINNSLSLSIKAKQFIYMYLQTLMSNKIQRTIGVMHHVRALEFHNKESLFHQQNFSEFHMQKILNVAIFSKKFHVTQILSLNAPLLASFKNHLTLLSLPIGKFLYHLHQVLISATKSYQSACTCSLARICTISKVC